MAKQWICQKFVLTSNYQNLDRNVMSKGDFVTYLNAGIAVLN